jgi:hypothetical protein
MSRSSAPTHMKQPVTAGTESDDEAILGIVSELTARPDVVDLQVVLSPSSLALPSVPLQDPLAKLVVGIRI